MTRSATPFLGLCLAAAVLTGGARVAAQTTPVEQASPRRQMPATSQPPAPDKSAQPAPPTTVLERDAREVREQFRELMSRYPPDLSRILRADPTLMQNPEYLSRYPGVAAFLASHPDIAHNPSFYLGFVPQDFDYRPSDPRSRVIDIWRNVVEGLMIFIMIVFVAAVLTWLMRTALDHRRWLRMSKTQNEVHNKLLDRFAGTNELLTYIQTPAGRRFLEAAPIAAEATGPGVGAPLGRILWSVQAGVVLLIGSLGFQFVSGRVIPEIAEGLWMIGVLGTAFGIGLILSGVVSYVLSRRLGLLDQNALMPPQRSDTSSV